MQRLDAENRPATDEEKRTLARYVGWGGLPQVFAWHEDESWEAERRRLEEGKKGVCRLFLTSLSGTSQSWPVSFTFSDPVAFYPVMRAGIGWREGCGVTSL